MYEHTHTRLLHHNQPWQTMRRKNLSHQLPMKRAQAKKIITSAMKHRM